MAPGETPGRMLAIESSCDETAAAVVSISDLEVLSNVVATQIPIHARYGGVVPELASRSHLTALPQVVGQALDDAGCTIDDIDGVAVTQGPGLAGCLLVGFQFAKALAFSRQLPLVTVDHIQAHCFAVRLNDAEGAGERQPEYPFVALAVSGGHTSLYRVESPGHMVRLGQTLDDAAGEAFDKIAKMMGLPYPGGIHIDRMALSGDRAAHALPRPMLHKGLDFSFSGLKTAVRYALEAGTKPDADLAASAQEAIVDCLIAKSLRACKQEGLSDLVLAGGVACNSRLRSAVAERAGHVRVWLTPPRYCTDNAAMVGGLGAALFRQDNILTGPALLSADIYTTSRPSREGA